MRQPISGGGELCHTCAFPTLLTGHPSLTGLDAQRGMRHKDKTNIHQSPCQGVGTRDDLCQASIK